jgi:hypothetical protein
MAINTTFTSVITNTEISVFENAFEEFTILIQNTKYVEDSSVFCFEDIKDAEEFIKIFKKELSLFKKLYV